jgi:putative DNA primase/helicase
MSSAPVISHRLYCTEGENNDENERNGNRKTGVRPLAAHSPGAGVKVIKNRHQACPVCGGSDRFRFDDKEGRGTWFCNQCGAGDGLKLVEKVFGVTPSEAAGKVNAVTGNLPPVAPEVIAAAEAETEADRKAAAALAVRLLEKTRPATGNAYLTRKGFPVVNV